MLVNRVKTFFSAAAVAIFLIAVSCAAAPADENLKVRIGLHISSNSGVSAAQFYDMTKGIMKIFKDKYGIEAVMKTYPTFYEVEDAFLKNEVDMALLVPGQVVEITEQGGAVHPWGVL